MIQSPTTRKHKQGDSPALTWPDDTDLLGLALELQPQQDIPLSPQYTTEFHSWFLDQVRRVNFELSSYLHDGQSEKPFTISGLSDLIKPQRRSSRGVATPKLLLSASQTYQWTITALSQPVVAWMRQWLQTPPTHMNLRSGSLRILNWAIAHPPITYNQLLQVAVPDRPTVTLSFLSPTSFRHKGNHLPLPTPEKVFHSYLRRWNDFSSRKFDQDAFLKWVDQSVVILRHQLQSAKVMAGKRGSVTGFTGAVQFGLSPTAHRQPEFVQLFTVLGQLAPYCGTGHKTTFGLGQTRLGWSGTTAATEPPSLQDLLVQRIAELTEKFTVQRKRTGGDRATNIAKTWATILARRELGESLQDIAQDLEMPYETVKTYVKLARRAVKGKE